MLFCDSPRLVNLSLEFQLRGNGVSFSSTIGYRSFSRPLPSSPNALVAVPLTAAEPLPTVEPPPQSEFTTVVLLLLLFGLLAAIFCTTTDAATAQCRSFDGGSDCDTRTGAENSAKKKPQTGGGEGDVG